MTHITLVLPFALPPSELAPDLIRALQTPSLATLITRTSSRNTLPFDDKQRALPYESWLAGRFGLPENGSPALAAQVMRAYQHEPDAGTWFIVNPAHLEVARSHLLLHDARHLQLSDEHARALFETARPYFEDSGKPLVYGDAATWFMRADDWSDLSTASPDAAAGLNLTDWLPTGERAAAFRKLQNEVQMLWFAHPANAEREQGGLAAVNGFWPWACADAGSAAALTNFAASSVPPWLAALARQPTASLDALLAAGGDAILVAGELTGPALATDWANWLTAMQHLEQQLFAPALAAVLAGRIGKLRLLVSHRTGHLELTTTRLAQRAFWRRPSLDALLP